VSYKYNVNNIWQNNVSSQKVLTLCEDHHFSSQGTFGNARFVMTPMMVDFGHKTLSMTVSILYMTISFCHGNQFFTVKKCDLSGLLKKRWYPTEHLRRNTPVWVWLLVIVYEIWVISRYSWKASKCDLYASTRGNAYNSLVLEKNLSETHLAHNCKFKA
jgi:hypothetical protein